MQFTKRQQLRGWRIVKFEDVARECKEKVDRKNNPFERYVVGGDMDSESLTLRRWGIFGEDYVGPAFHRIFRKGQILYGSRRTYLKKVAVANFDGITANTTFVIEPKKGSFLIPGLLPHIMLSDGFTKHSVGNSKGSTNPYIVWSDISKYEFLLPPRARQKEMLRILEGIENALLMIEKSLDGSRRFLDALLLNQVWKNSEYGIVDLGEVTSIKKGSPITKKKITKGDIPVIAGGKQPAYFHNAANRSGEVITVSASGAYAGFINYFNTPIFASDCSTVESTSSRGVNMRFLYSLLKSKQNYFYRLQVGGAQPHVYPKHIHKVRIPLPSIEVQEMLAEKLEYLHRVTMLLENKIYQIKTIRSAYSKSVFEEVT